MPFFCLESIPSALNLDQTSLMRHAQGISDSSMDYSIHYPGKHHYAALLHSRWVLIRVELLSIRTVSHCVIALLARKSFWSFVRVKRYVGSRDDFGIFAATFALYTSISVFYFSVSAAICPAEPYVIALPLLKSG